MRLVEAHAAFFGGTVVLVLIRVRIDAVTFVAAVALHQVFEKVYANVKTNPLE